MKAYIQVKQVGKKEMQHRKDADRFPHSSCQCAGTD